LSKLYLKHYWSHFFPDTVYMSLTLGNFKTLKITNSAIKEHLVGINEANYISFVYNFLNVFYLDEHVLSVSFSTH